MPPGEIDGKLYEPMSRHTTLLVGGPAQYWIEPHSFYGFAFLVDYCRERGIPVRVVGRGSNLLVRDGGIRGAVIHPTGGVFSEVTVGTPRRDHRRGGRALEETRQHRRRQRHRRLRVDGRHPRQRRRRAAHERRRDGHRNLRPGGARHLPRRGRRHPHPRARGNRRQLPQRRRNCGGTSPCRRSSRARPTTPENIKQRWDESREKRKASQPVIASAGCTFKNPEDIPAGRVIDSLGLKGTTCGHAAVSEVHGNFVVNQGGATAAEILTLIEFIQEKARDRTRRRTRNRSQNPRRGRTFILTQIRKC